MTTAPKRNPAIRRVVVIGASAGGVEALSYLMGQLPPDLPASVFVVVHIPPNAVSVLPRILTRTGNLPAVHATDEMLVESGAVYVAPPDRHLLLFPGCVRTVRGPRENGHRPAVDPLFRSAARSYGRRAIGVVLTGNLDDGTVGMQAIKRMGGIGIVQDPDEALHPGMPRSAMTHVAVDHVLPLAEIAPTIVRLVNEPVPEREEPVDDKLSKEVGIAKLDLDILQSDRQPGDPSGFTCPECHGGLWEVEDGDTLQYRCRVGHAYSVETLLAAQNDGVEVALWAALRALEENAALARRLAARSEERDHKTSATRFKSQAEQTEAYARTIRDLLLSDDPAATPDATSVVAPD